MPLQRFLVAVDGSDLAARALVVARGLAEAVSGQIGLVHVIDADPAGTEAGLPATERGALRRREGQRLLDTVAATIPSPPWTFLREGHPVTEIIESAREWSADLVVLGTHGRSGLSRLWLGSTAEGVARRAPCPVVVVPPSVAIAEPG